MPAMTKPSRTIVLRLGELGNLDGTALEMIRASGRMIECCSAVWLKRVR